jgi:hypothetical protein
MTHSSSQIAIGYLGLKFKVGGEFRFMISPVFSISGLKVRKRFHISVDGPMGAPSMSKMRVAVLRYLSEGVGLALRTCSKK